mmetsp:Transcript_2938/g.11164  ORF Transcript_2938/g.11164 Transcript_2938/m.11164 type:complete len:347 (-) Transcript_2938:745-1785(-)
MGEKPETRFAFAARPAGVPFFPFDPGVYTGGDARVSLGTPPTRVPPPALSIKGNPNCPNPGRSFPRPGRPLNTSPFSPPPAFGCETKSPGVVNTSANRFFSPSGDSTEFCKPSAALPPPERSLNPPWYSYEGPFVTSKPVNKSSPPAFGSACRARFAGETRAPCETRLPPVLALYVSLPPWLVRLSPCTCGPVWGGALARASPVATGLFQPFQSAPREHRIRRHAAPLGTSLFANTRMGPETPLPNTVSPSSEKMPNKSLNTLHLFGPNALTWLDASSIEMNKFRASFHLSPASTSFAAAAGSALLAPPFWVRPCFPKRWIADKMGPWHPFAHRLRVTGSQELPLA